MSKNNLDQLMSELTSKVVTLIEQDLEGKWSKPWTTLLAGSRFPVNAVTEKSYRGMNALVGMVEVFDKDYSTQLFATYKQWQSIGGQVQRGQKGTHMVKWKPRYRCHNCERTSDINKCPHDHLVTRYMAGMPFTVFNYDQQQGYEIPVIPKGMDEQYDGTLLRQFIDGTGATITHKVSNDAFYSPMTDEITLPLIEQFDSYQGYQGTLLHELTHWTGHPSRLNRVTPAGFGSTEYAKEELVAELGAVFHAAALRLETEPHIEHRHYLVSWLKILKEEPRALYRAASQAQAALEYTLELTGMEHLTNRTRVQEEATT